MDPRMAKLLQETHKVPPEQHWIYIHAQDRYSVRRVFRMHFRSQEELLKSQEIPPETTFDLRASLLPNQAT